MARIRLHVTSDAALSLREQGDASLSLKGDYVGDPLPEYHGPVTVTPATYEQTLLTHGTHLSQDVTIAPIPNNYGLITWNGSTLTVS